MANAEVALTRIDTRMVHGAVVKAWAKKCGTKRAIMIDDFLAADPFMADFYKRGKDRGLKLDILDPVKAGEAWAQEKFGPDGKKVMVIAKDVFNLQKMWKAGYPLTEVNIGKNNYDTGKHEITTTVFFSEEEWAALKEIAAAGVRIYVQVSPEDEPIEFDEIERIYNGA